MPRLALLATLLCALGVPALAPAADDVATLLLAADRFCDRHALTLVDRQLTLIEREAEVSGDGTFYGHRLAPMRRRDPHYYTRLEADRASALAMLLNHLPLVQEPAPAAAPFEDSVAGEWREEAHGAIMHRSPNRLASFAWRAQVSHISI